MTYSKGKLEVGAELVVNVRIHATRCLKEDDTKPKLHPTPNSRVKKTLKNIFISRFMFLLKTAVMDENSHEREGVGLRK